MRQFLHNISYLLNSLVVDSGHTFEDFFFFIIGVINFWDISWKSVLSICSVYLTENKGWKSLIYLSTTAFTHKMVKSVVLCHTSYNQSPLDAANGSFTVSST